jgi:hypothetical protein
VKRLVFFLFLIGPAAIAAEDRIREQWTASYNRNDISEMGIPLWRGEIRRLVSRWTSAGKVDFPTLAAQFAEEGRFLSRRDRPVCCGPAAVRVAFTSDPSPFVPPPAKLSADEIWFVWRATAIPVTSLDQELIAMVAFARIDDERSSPRLNGLVRHREGEWEWLALWPASAPGLSNAEKTLEGSIWRVAEMTAREEEFLLFAGGVFVSGTSAARGFPPGTYSARRTKNGVEWTARQRSAGGEERVWRGRFSQSGLRGEDRIVRNGETVRQWDWSASPVHASFPNRP